MPSLEGLAEGTTPVPCEPERLSTTYLDTEDLRLARWGVSFRHRLGEGWTVKLPTDDHGTLLARSEITFAGERKRPPPAAVDLVRAFIRSAELRPQTSLKTLRRRTELHDADGQLLADVVDDEVSVLEGRRIVARFRELEVEVRGDLDPSALDVIVDRFRQAGAGRTGAHAEIRASARSTIVAARGPDSPARVRSDGRRRRSPRDRGVRGPVDPARPGRAPRRRPRGRPSGTRRDAAPPLRPADIPTAARSGLGGSAPRRARVAG